VDVNTGSERIPLAAQTLSPARIIIRSASIVGAAPDTEPCVNQRPNLLRSAPRRSPTQRQTPELQPLIDHLREVAQGRGDIRTECAGVIAGAWFSDPARRGEELIAAGLLMLAGHVDLDELDRWMRIGWERRRGADIPYAQTS
jgi:hypothetical protein